MMYVHFCILKADSLKVTSSEIAIQRCNLLSERTNRLTSPLFIRTIMDTSDFFSNPGFIYKTQNGIITLGNKTQSGIITLGNKTQSGINHTRKYLPQNNRPSFFQASSDRNRSRGANKWERTRE